MADLYTSERAAEILRAALGGTAVPRDVPRAPAGTHDFDLTFTDGRTIAVEVTISADRDSVEFWDVVHKTDWEAPQLRQSWLLNVTPPARVRTLRDKVETLLQGFEKAGIHKFGLGTRVDTPEVRELHRLLVKSGDVWPNVQPSRIGIYHTAAGSASTDLVRDVVEFEVWKDDNRKKLERAKSDERHLFVWIDVGTSPAAPAAGSMDMSPPSACELPPETDVAWIVIPGADDDGNQIVNLWRFDRGSGWQEVASR